GEKPFFYQYKKENDFQFASEMKALMIEQKPEVNRKMLFNYMAYNVSQNPTDQSETFFKNIFKLEPAHYLFIDEAGRIEKKCYWKIDASKQVKISEEEAEKKFRELFFQSVERRLRSDVPIGSSLSGGVDSSSVVCVIGKLNGENPFPQNTFSARFHDSNFDEGKFIDEVAARTPLNKHEVWVNEEVLFADLQNVIYHIEEPLSNSSPLAQWKVMQLAKEKNVTVLLDGQGTDETLAGYLHFFKPYFAELLFADKKKYREELLQYKKLRGVVFDGDGKFESGIKFGKLFLALGKIRRRISTPSYLNFLNEDFIRENRNENPPFKVFTKLNDSLKFFSTEFGLEKLLTYADRNSMAFSREIRLPFLSHELVEFIFSLPTEMKINNGWTKFILRKSMEEIIPGSIAWRIDKLGYQPPINSWLQQPKAQQMIVDAKDFLVERKLIRKNTEIKGREWMLLNSALFLKAFNQ
ncbi:MAG: asparagine synthase-related protein, partial [Bacteroidota bacterium]